MDKPPLTYRSAGLDLDDVNLSARMVRVLGKGRKERIVPFNASTAKAIRAYLGERETLVRARDRRDGRRSNPLFVNYRGGRLTARSIDRLVRRYVAASSARRAPGTPRRSRPPTRRPRR